MKGLSRFLLVLALALVSVQGVSAQNRQKVPGVLDIKNYNQKQVWQEYPGAKFNIYLNPVGMIAGADWGGQSVELVAGVRFNKYCFIGAETGYDYLTTQHIYCPIDKIRREAFVPLALNVKGLLPYGNKCCPFIESSFGAYFGIMDLDTNDLYFKSGLGFEFNRFVAGAGYTWIPVVSDRHLWYVRFGFRIGR